MADASYRFHQGAGQYFFPQHNPQSLQPRQIHHRNESPGSNGRIFNTDTPSPTRSPRQHSPTHAQYGMYNQNHQQGSNMYMNGGQGHQRYGMQVNSSKPYQNHIHHGQLRQQQDHGSHGHNNFGGHQHNSSANGFSGNAPHFHSSQARNGTPAHMHNGLSRPINEHWAHQLALAQAARESTGTHPHARNHPAGKTVSSIIHENAKKDADKDDRKRISDNPISIEAGHHEWSRLDMGGQGLRALSLGIFRDYTFVKELYLNSNKLAFLPPAIGRLRNLTLLDLSLNDLMELPAEIGMLTNLRHLLLFDNHLETLPYELGSLYQLEVLGIEGNPLNEALKSVVMEEGTKALITMLREQADPPEAPMDRPWEDLDGSKVAGLSQPEKFSVLSYNTLCDKSATQSHFGYTPRNALMWENRKTVILDELRSHDADVMCLQEIDKESYEEFFRPALAENPYRYKGLYWQRPRAKTMTEKEAKVVDGCAIFYKDRKFILLDKQHIDLSNTAINRPDMRGEHDVFNRVMPRDHIGVVAFLENRQTGARVMVANTHIYWNPAFVDVKVVQVAILMEQIAKIAETCAKHPPLKDKAPYAHGDADDVPAEDLQYAPSLEYTSGPQIPLIICGDFNSPPGSGVYDLISHGELACSHNDLGDFRYGNFTRDGMTHPFTLKSAYGAIGELRFTNYTPNYADVIDYIWYSPHALQVTGLLGAIDENYLLRVPGFPNYHFPSDHVALMADFAFKPRKSERRVVEADFGPVRGAEGEREERPGEVQKS